VLVVWAIQRTIGDAWAQLADYRLQIQPGWLVAAAGLYLAGLLPAAVFWRHVLRTLGQDPRWGETVRAYFVGHLGKYVPGKAMVVVIRTGLIRSQRVGTGVAAASVFVETLTMMAAGAFVAAAILACWFGAHTRMLAGAIGLMVIAGLPTLPPVFRRLARWAGVARSEAGGGVDLHRLRARTLLLGWCLMVLGWCLLGLSYWATLRAMGLAGADPWAQWPRYTASVALAMVAGFLALVFPGGVGVREAALVELMLPYFRQLGPGVAAHAELAAWASAAMLRLIWLGTELVAAGVSWVASRRS